jgi:hypothetical protein
MLESGGGGDFSAAMVNSILLALWAILPALAVAYARQRALAPPAGIHAAKIRKKRTQARC